MLDGLFGRPQLKARVEELEAELAALQAKLTELETEAERLRERSEREKSQRREAVAARQQAQEQANKLKERITQLEGDLERAQDQTPQENDVGYRRRERLSERRLAAVQQRLGSFRTGREGALTATVHDTIPQEVTDVLGERTVLVQDAAPCLVLADDAGIISLALRPPLVPKMDPVWDEQFLLEPEWFEPTGRFAMVLVRANLFAAGIYEGREQLSFKGFQPKVDRRHSKGGFSQGRFERIREEQIADHVRRCREILQDFLGDVQQLYLVGQREIIDALAKDREPEATMNVDATGAPRQALDEAFQSFWTTELRVL